MQENVGNYQYSSIKTETAVKKWQTVQQSKEGDKNSELGSEENDIRKMTEKRISKSIVEIMITHGAEV